MRWYGHPIEPGPVDPPDAPRRSADGPPKAGAEAESETASERGALFRVVEALRVELRELSAALEQAEKERGSESAARLAAESLLQSEWERLSGVEAELGRIGELEAQAARVAELEGERKKLAQRIGELEGTLVGRDSEVRSLGEQLNEARGRIAELRIAELESQLRGAAELDSERQRSQEAAAELRSTLGAERNSLRTELEAVQRRSAEAAELRSTLETERGNLAQRIGELEETVAKRDNDARVLAAQLSEARGRIAELDAEARQVDIEWDLLRSELEAEQQRSAEAAAEFRSTFEAERGRLAGRIGELEEKLGRRENEARGLGEQLSEARGRVEAQAQRAASIEAERDRLQAELEAVRDRLQTELEEVRQRSEEAAAELRSTLEAERERLARRIDELEGTVVGRDNQARVLEEQLDGARSRVAELEAQAQQTAEMKAERHRLRTELEAVRRRSEEATAELHSVVEAERGKLAERIDELNALLVRRNNEARALEGQLSEARGRVAELEGRAHEAAELEAERDRMRVELGIVRQRSEEAATELRSAIQAERLMLAKRIDKLGVELLGRDDQARSLVEQLDEARRRVVEFEAQAQQIAQIEAERDRLRGELETRRQGSERAAAEFRTTLDAERTKLAKRIQQVEGRLLERESDARALGERLSEARTRVKELEEQAEASSMRSFSTWVRTLTSRG
jgi:chromosome segregation ATPase